MRKYIDSEELKNKVREELNKDGSKFAEAIGVFFCAMIDETPAADVVEREEVESE